MNIPLVLAWLLTAAFLLLTFPAVSRLTRLDYVRLGSGVRQQDVAGLLMAVAMLAMVSPVGAPIPVAGWEALFVLTAGWFVAAAVRDRSAQGVCRRCDLHYGIAAVAMFYMLLAMPHGDGGHTVWPNMVSGASSGGMAWPVLAALGAAYFTYDGVQAGMRGLRLASRTGDTARETLPPGFVSRTVCRAGMGLGMAIMFVAGL
ncbi:ABC-type transport system involved in cytochrome c biogenesis permease subunit [Saccharomonospora amisosensis]|uniref:ABC-type transport system involved in cytochrome c biogenesis permease subunit n=1 Tax=Saccharomonospora amisosensis TaxID=1128677 RepID=A0A7X5URB7_9PSEU|nr:DUF5134 domain-containing protein [Saccharomonospora amisosensis]NIJ12736.1 ABC-type transport system involved in cytochrome c biogenesis permease subunit [Saccharomonospora amisosensis]